MKLPFLLVFCLGVISLPAQAPFTQKQFEFRVEKDLVYGSSVDYAGQNTELTLDLYKPIGDNNTDRPLLVMVHGGAWLAGCKENEAFFAEEFARRGYVVASVNYRKGWHKDDYVPAAINPNVFPGGNCLYAADSSELIRAIYRGQQDVKGAIRWLKARALADSTCNQAVLVGGSSAGAFLALAVGLLDRPEEKPDACYALAAAPIPAANVSNCYDYNCVTQTIQPEGTALSRPDLGPVDGDLNQNGYNAEVLGVISIFGGVPYEASSKNWIQGPDTPALYLYHQTCDGIVPFGYGKPMSTISVNCNLGFTPWHGNYPNIFGNGAIAAYLQPLLPAARLKTDFLECPAFNPALALFECVRYNDNGSYHWAHAPAQRAQLMADFFNPIITTKVNSMACLVPTKSPVGAMQLRIWPNPFNSEITLELPQAPAQETELALIDVTGNTVWSEKRKLSEGRNRIVLPESLSNGFYHLIVRGTGGVAKLVK
ncbi:MAG: carboxylesterase family protein [Saprospiraceae bacterium]|nr:carboxylesterase family protein [Saprospiraceae bacterium]